MAKEKRPMTLNAWFWIVNTLIVLLSVTSLYIGLQLKRELVDAQARTEVQRERAAAAESMVIENQKGSASVRSRLVRLENAVLPRRLSAAQESGIGRELQNLGPVNVAFKANAPEPSMYATAMLSSLQASGLLGSVYQLTGDDHYYIGVTLVVGNPSGEEIATRLNRLGIPVRPLTSGMEAGYDGLPKEQNTLVVGDNDAALGGVDGSLDATTAQGGSPGAALPP